MAIKNEPRAWFIKDGKKQKLVYDKPKRLSKLGEWMRDHPNGLDVVHVNWSAVLK